MEHALHRLQTLERHIGQLHQKWDLRQDDAKQAIQILGLLRNDDHLREQLLDITIKEAHAILTERVVPFQTQVERRLTAHMVQYTKV
jgi:hypothetical protein